MIGLVAILMGFWASFLVWTYLQDKRLSIKELDHQALGIYHYIILSRRWIAKQSGIFIKKGPDSYALLTPSKFTEALAEFSSTIMPFDIKLSVKDSTNPNFIPDDFESAAIRRFSRGESSHTCTIEKTDDGRENFLFVAPLYFTNECSSCHEKGDKRGNKAILGSISVSLPAGQILASIEKRLYTNIALFMITLFLAVAFLWAMLKKLVLNPLDQLHLVSKKVGRGDLKARVDIKVSPEWDTVAESFNNMMDAIEKQNVRLESAVKESVAQLETAYEELKLANRYKSTFFSSISHDLKTPITAIKGASEIMAKRLKNHDDLTTYVEIIGRNVEKLSKMVHDLLICAKLESGPHDLNLEDNDVSEIVEDCILMLMPIKWEKKINLHYNVADKALIVQSDRAMMDQLFTNLISNAIKFSPVHGTVRVDVGAVEGTARITVEDSGPGIPEADWDKVFRKFYRARTTASQEGMGLGLAISKFIVEAHHGTIRLGRSGLGGILVEVTLPLQSQ